MNAYSCIYVNSNQSSIFLDLYDEGILLCVDGKKKIWSFKCLILDILIYETMILNRLITKI